jgi:methyltransferase (TIGR00027 family)
LAAIMREGRPSVTARRVAAYRLGFDRLATGFGDPSADERLAADVAGAETFELGERMVRYLRARTSFFDRVALNAIERGVTQLLVVGTGYDGRPLRYAGAGVRWFEVDHPDTQSDKRARLDRLGIGTGHIAFVGADLRKAGLARTLLAAGFEADAPAQIICEGVAVYLDPAVLERLLTELRAVATPGTRLALSTSVSLPAGDQAVRERFAARVEAAGGAGAQHLDRGERRGAAQPCSLAGRRGVGALKAPRLCRHSADLAPCAPARADDQEQDRHLHGPHVPPQRHRYPGRPPRDHLRRRRRTTAPPRRGRLPRPSLRRFDALRAALARADGCGDLPHALTHPDFVPANALATASGGTVILDWAGTGWAPWG